MVSLGNPKTWVPYMDTEDCSQGFCSSYCPQWCYIIFPPPPPIQFPDESSGSSFSPLVIALIGILASAFLLMSYYTIISKYCGKMESARRENHNLDGELEANHNPSLHEPWNVITTGLDEALIKSITVCKFKKGDGLIEGTDCSVCLNEFEENECLRLLPKCSHAFHLECIDTWLKSHSNCPLCRANIVQFHPAAVTESHVITEFSVETQRLNQNAGVEEDSEMGIGQNREEPKSPLRVLSDSRNSDDSDRDTVIEIENEEHQHIRRSFSMSYACQNHVSVADILCMKQNEYDHEIEELEFPENDGSSSKQSTQNRVLHCVSSPVRMKRSFSSGRFLFSKNGRLHKGIIPVRSFVSKNLMQNS